MEDKISAFEMRINKGIGLLVFLNVSSIDFLKLGVQSNKTHLVEGVKNKAVLEKLTK
jgi:hypothetical protein